MSVIPAEEQPDWNELPAELVSMVSCAWNTKKIHNLNVSLRCVKCDSQSEQFVAGSGRNRV
jgi:cytochrome c-type biogenesis protein CcmH/NrfF